MHYFHQLYNCELKEIMSKKGPKFIQLYNNHKTAHAYLIQPNP